MTRQRGAILLKSKLLPIGGIVMAVLLVYAGISLAKTMDTLGEVEEMTTLLKEEIETAKSEALELEELMAQSETDEAIAEAARDRLGLINQGEILYIDNYR